MEFTLHETILSYFKLSLNAKQTGYPQMREAADLSWYKLFKKTKESNVRKWVLVENGIVPFPCSMENLLGIYVEDECGELCPLYEDNFKNTLKKPALKCSCPDCVDDCMCPVLQDSTVQTEVEYNGEFYTNKVILRILKNGDVVEYRIDWVPSYDATGLLIDVIPVETQTTKCNVAVKPCGCVLETTDNTELLVACGCVTDTCVPYLRNRYPSLYNEYGYYKVDTQQKKIFLFCSNGKKSKLKQVMLSFQSNGADILIPEYARPALIALFDWTKKMYSPLYQPVDRLEAKRNFAREKNEMIKYLNPIPYELVTESGDYIASRQARRRYGIGLSYSNQNVIEMCCDHTPNCQCAVCCPTTPPAVTNVINHTTVINQGDLEYNFDVAASGWTSAIIPTLIGKTISTIYVDGIKRKFQEVSEGDVTTPPAGTFYWKKASGTLIYAPSLNQDQWVSIHYRD